MNKMFILIIIFVFLTIFVESINLILQLKGRRLTKRFGKNAFPVHMIITGSFWIVTFFLFIIFQFEDHPLFHNSSILRYAGLVLLISGMTMALWAFKLLGLKRSLCLNFFEDNVPIIKTPLYNYIKNPEDYGLWMTLIGFALFTGSVYDLVIAVEFIFVMIPHMILENVPLDR